MCFGCESILMTYVHRAGDTYRYMSAERLGVIQMDDCVMQGSFFFNEWKEKKIGLVIDFDFFHRKFNERPNFHCTQWKDFILA